MVPKYRSSTIEAAIMLLDKCYDSVMVRSLYSLPRPIRVRPKLLESIRPFIVRNAPEFDSELQAWNEQYGTLINYRPFREDDPRLPHNATFLCECPLFLEGIEKLSRDAMDCCVIYTPPSWRIHEEGLYVRFPPASTCKRLYQIVSMTKPLQEYLSIANILGLPTSGTRVVNEDDVRDELQLKPLELTIVRKRTLRCREGGRYRSILQLVPRVEPEDKRLLEFYRHIESLPALGHVRLALNPALSAAMRYWKIGLRALIRSGSVERKAQLGFYFLDGLKPDYERIQNEHLVARSNYAKMVDVVSKLPLMSYPLPEPS